MNVGDQCKKNFRENKSHVYLKTETKGDDIREKIKDNKIIMISVKSKAVKGHAAKLKEKFTYALKESNYGNMDHKEEKNQFINLQKRMGKIIIKLATLKISVCLNIQ